MDAFHWLINGFLMPGDLVIRRIGITIEEDGGILRSFINMCFWGFVTVLIVFAVL